MRVLANNDIDHRLGPPLSVNMYPKRANGSLKDGAMMAASCGATTPQFKDVLLDGTPMAAKCER